MSMIGEAYVRIRPIGGAEFTRELDRQTAPGLRRFENQLRGSNRELSRFSRGALVGTGALQQLGRAAAFASISFIGGAGIVVGIKSAVDAASNLEEQLAKTKVVFGDAADGVIAFSEDALLLARDRALETASSIGALLRPLGVIPKQAAETSVTLTKLGVDLSSFYNTSVADALQAIKSGLVGEVEPLRRYGVVLSEARVQQKALNDTGKESVEQLTNQEKVLARVSLILRDTAQAQGDAERTAGGFANQQRELQKNIRNTQILLGQTLIPTLTGYLVKANEWLGETENQERVQRAVNEAVREGEKLLGLLTDALVAAKAAADPVVDALGGMRNTLELIIALAVARKLVGIAGGLTAVAGAGVAAGAGLTAAGAGATRAAAGMTILAGSIGTASFTSLGSTAVATTASVSRLRTALLRLGTIGVIAVGIDLLINRRAIDDWVDTTLPRWASFSGMDLFARKDLKFNSAKEARAWAIAHRHSEGPWGEVARKILMQIAPDVTWGGPGSLFQGSRPEVTADNQKRGVVPGGVGNLFGSAAATRGDITATNLARAQAEGTKKEIVAAANARLDFIRDTISFANKLIAEGRGDTAKLYTTLQKFYGDEASTQGIIDGIAEDADTARKNRIQDAIDKGQKRARDAIDAYNRWREARQEEIDAIVEGVAKQRGIDQLRAANAEERQATQEAIQEQILQNNLLTAQLIPNEKKRLAAEKAAQMLFVQLFRDRARQYKTSTLAGLQEIGKMRTAKLALANLGKGTSTGGGGFSLQEFFTEAGEQFELYGSNVGSGPLSPQDARASFDRGTSKTSSTTVHQHFYGERGAGQALSDAARVAKNMKD